MISITKTTLNRLNKWGAGGNLVTNNINQDNRASRMDGGHPSNNLSNNISSQKGTINEVLNKSIHNVNQHNNTNTFPDPIKTDKQTIGNPVNKFYFKNIDIKKMATLINNMKPTFSTELDDINMNTIK